MSRDLIQNIESSSSELLAQFQSRSFLACAGSETYLVFQQKFDLPEFAAFILHDNPEELKKFTNDHLQNILAAAASTGHGLVLDMLVWRASPDHLKLLGRDTSEKELRRIHKTAIDHLRDFVGQWRIKNGFDAVSFPVLFAADIGPRGDGYKVDDANASSETFLKYHSEQIKAIADVGGVDLVSALTITSVNEAIGISRACSNHGLPLTMSVTVETDGRLPDGNELRTFVERTDEMTSRYPLFYMVNCCHPSHLRPTLQNALDNKEPWLNRIRGFRANASCKSHEELDNSTELDRGDVSALATSMAEMKDIFGLYVVGGCCGTDHEHIAEIAKQL